MKKSQERSYQLSVRKEEIKVKIDKEEDDMAESQNNDVSGWRREIDEVDEQIVRLMNRRARAAMEIGKLKHQSGQAIYVPDREKKVFDHLHEVNEGPLPNRVLEAIWRELIGGCINLERKMQIGYLGPEGSFSHLAATRKFGASAEYVPQTDIREVFLDVVRGRSLLGVVPVENSLGGVVIDTLDAFLDVDVKICGELIVAIHHNFLANGPIDLVKTIYSKPEIFAQCRTWLSENMKGVELVPVTSSSRAAEMASKEPNSAAIGSSLSAELYKIKLVYENIEDNPGNRTRFFIISSACAGQTGHDKTSILFATANESGALVEVLEVFRRHELNMTAIESRPSGRGTWEYYFFVDVEGHHLDTSVQAAIEEAKKHCLHMKVLGSYPKADEAI
jgi:chorismate mutase/prephenate dehydratase